MEEKKPTNALELSDGQLLGVAGGAGFAEVDGRLYRRIGEGREEGYGESYLCPNCGRPVSYSDWLRFYCDACGGNWCYESELVPNLAGGMWKEIDRSSF